MRWFTHNYLTNKEENRQLEILTSELRQTLGELECEEAIIKDKKRFGRVRTNIMKVLRAKYGDNVANRALSRVNKRIQENYFDLRNEFF